MRLSEQIYAHLPVRLQNTVCSYIGHRINRVRYSDQFDQLLTECTARLALNQESLQAFRDAELSRFVRHAAESVPYYRRQFADRGTSAGQIRSLTDLDCLPILTKAEVQSNLRGLKSEAVAGKDCLIHHTSGTTGTGLTFPSTYQAQRHQWAVWWRYRLALGITFEQWAGLFGGRRVVSRSQTKPPFWRINRPGRRILFSGYHLREDWLGSYIDEIKRRELTWLHGYPSHLNLLARHAIEHRISFSPAIEFVTIGAESLLDYQRENIRRAFGCDVRQHYGLAEAVANISECPHGVLHVDEDFSAVEFVPIVGRDGFRIIGTNFTNPAFPLLRYDTGDIAYGLKMNNNCLCGRAGRTVEQIDGRVEDCIILKDGTRVGRLDHIFKDLTQVREAQFVQQAPGKLLLRIVRGPEFSSSIEHTIRRESIQRLGKDLDLTFEYRDQLDRTGSAKLRFVVTETDHGPTSSAS